ncbi:3469_t:CDS:2 [Acaulospora morrowiae]|uniref:3469_t:CDS:1 n=1 Tax=Acaulospora morrowiae TaxID=94023 RepID=A0A9N8ZYM0_9GLOM|nr:3469_t:CDS:2 [Acaulospora morrowiae]
MVTRFLLGTFEAGFFPGVVFYITMWYKRSEQNYRVGLLFSGATIAGAFGGLLGYLVMDLNGKYGLSGWQWIFLIDGSVTVVAAIIAYFTILDFPQTAKWLSESERKLALQRLQHDTGSLITNNFRVDQIMIAVRDWKVWISTFIFMGIVAGTYSFSFFIPTIVHGMGFTPVISQLLTAPPFICGSVTTISTAILSDKIRNRALFLTSFLTFTMCGYLLLIIPGASTAVKYLGTCVIGLGLFPCVSISITWLTSNMAGDLKRAVGSAIMLSVGNIGGVIASQMYQSKDSPDYRIGNTIALCFLMMSTVLVSIQHQRLKKENERKIRDPGQYLKGKSEEEIGNLGDIHPEFIYNL